VCLLDAAAELGSGYGAYLVQTALALVAVSALALVTLRLLRRRAGPGGPGLRVVARLALEPRRSIYVVEAAGRYLVVGVGDGPMALLAELDATRAAALESAEPASAPLVELVRRALGRPASRPATDGKGGETSP
jgi:flagellar protein FliO/FliZ